VLRVRLEECDAVCFDSSDLRCDVSEMDSEDKKTVVYMFYFNTCTVHLLLFCTMTNQCAVNLKTVTVLLLHVSTLLCHPQGARS